MGLESVTGSIKTGLSADFIILDRNIFEIDPCEIHETKVDQTFFEGRNVYKREVIRA